MPLRASVQYKNNRPQVDREVSKFIDRAVKKSAFLMERNMKEVATTAFVQRTGNLRRSIRAYTGKDLPFGSAEVRINPIREGADVNYALYLEYGTRYIAPRAFIRRGAGISRKQIKFIFADEAKKVKVNVTNGVK